MANRVRLLLFSMIPAFSASVIYWLWKYNKRSKKSIEDSDKKSASDKKVIQELLPERQSSGSKLLKAEPKEYSKSSDEKDDKATVQSSVSNTNSSVSVRDSKISSPDVGSGLVEGDVKFIQENNITKSESNSVENRQDSNNTNDNVDSSMHILNSISNKSQLAELSHPNNNEANVTVHQGFESWAEACENHIIDSLKNQHLNDPDAAWISESRFSDLASQDPAVLMVGVPLQNHQEKLVNGTECAAITSLLNGFETSATVPLNQSSDRMTRGDGTIAEFDLPGELCGMLIGRQGRSINAIKNESGAKIKITAKVYVPNYQLITVEGTKSQVDKAMDLIKQKFPRRRFPDLDFTQAVPDVAPPQPEVFSGLSQLSLPVNVQSDVFISCVIAPNHVFVQQPTHPTFPDLERLKYEMNSCYSTAEDSIPGLPVPYEVGVLCAAPVDDAWYRAQIMNVEPETDECDIKLVDMGGYLRVLGSTLKQIRFDFMTFPFQAIECYLAGVIPPIGENEEESSGVFPPNGSEVLDTLTRGSILSAEVIAIETDGVPYIRLYNNKNNQIVDVNRELVEAGVASWYEI